MKRLCFYSIICVALLLVVVGQVQAGDKTGVHVRFILKEPAFRGKFARASEPTSELLEELESRAAASISRKLCKNAGFLHFTSEESKNFTLTFTLARADPQASEMLKEVGLFVKLTGPKNKAPTVYQIVRTAEESEGLIGGMKEVLKEMDLAVGTPTFLDSIRDDILREVPVCDTGVVLADPMFGWLTPFTHQDLQIDKGSKFKITNRVPSPFNQNNTIDYNGQASVIVRRSADPPWDRYIGQLFCKPADNNKGDLDELLKAVKAGKAAVVRMFVIDYCLLDMDSPGPTPPEDSEF